MHPGGEPPTTTFDANLLVSTTIVRRGGPFDAMLAWRTGLMRLITSREQLAELARTLRKPKFVRYGVTEHHVWALLRQLATRADLVMPRLPAPLPVRDVADEHILALAVTGNANFLVTGDQDLLTLARDPRLAGLQIVTIARLLTLLVEGDGGEPNGTHPSFFQPGR